MKTLAERLIAAREEKCWKKSDLQRAANLKSASTLTELESGRRTESPQLPTIAEALGVSVIWLQHGRGPMRQNRLESFTQSSVGFVSDTDRDYSPIKRVRFKLSAGVSGYSIDVDDSESQPIFFRKDWFDRHGYKPDRLLAVRVSGDSMVPSLYDGDLVVVNTDDTRPRDGEVFAANYEGELVIKRVRIDGGACWLDSDASDQVRFRPRQCGEGCFILGRVIYKQSERI